MLIFNPQPFLFFPVLTFLVNGFTLVFIYSKGILNRSNHMYLLYALALQIWLTSQICQLIPAEIFTHPFFVRMDSLAWILTGLTLPLFIYAFLGKKTDLPMWLMILNSSFWMVMNFLTDMIVIGGKTTGLGIRMNFGPWMTLAAVTTVVIPTIYSLALTSIRYMKERNFFLRRQLLLLIAGMAFTLVAGTILDLVLGFVRNDNIHSATPSIFIFQIILVFIITVRYRFLSFGVTDISDQMFECFNEGIIILNADGKLQNINPAACRMIGVDEKTATGGAIGEYIPSFSLERKPRKSIVSLKDRKTVEISSSPITTLDLPLGTFVLMKDVTEMHQIKKQLLFSARLASIGNLAAGIAHEINNPLAIISGRTTFLRDRLREKAGCTALLEKIDNSTSRIAKITSSLRKLSCDDTDECIVFKLGEAISDCVTLSRNLLTKSGVDLQLLAMDEVFARGNPGSFQQVIMNLIINARDALETRKDGKIILSLMKTSSTAFISIEDNGSGMEQETVSHLFEPFFTTKDVGKGTGLGLSISRATITGMGGRIDVDSTPGKGTVFTIVLPVADATGSHRDTSSETGTPRLTGRVLLVDDEAEIREIIASYVRATGMSVVTADCGAAALSLLKEDSTGFDILLTDLKMPGMSGEELVARARASQIRQPAVIAMTGVLSSNMDGVRHILFKPFTRADLYSVLKSLVK